MPAAANAATGTHISLRGRRAPKYSKAAVTGAKLNGKGRNRACTATAKTRNRYASMFTSGMRLSCRIDALFDSVRHAQLRQARLSAHESYLARYDNRHRLTDSYRWTA